MSKLNTVLASAALAATFAAWNASPVKASLTFEVLNSTGSAGPVTIAAGAQTVTLSLWAVISGSPSGLYDAVNGGISTAVTGDAAGTVGGFTASSGIILDPVTSAALGTTVTGVNANGSAANATYGLPANTTAGKVEIGTFALALTGITTGNISVNYVAPGTTSSTTTFQDIWAENYTYTTSAGQVATVSGILTNSTVTNPGTVAVGSPLVVTIGTVGPTDLYIDVGQTHTVVGNETWLSINKQNPDPNTSATVGGHLVIPTGTSITITPDTVDARQTRPIVTVLDTLAISGTGSIDLGNHDMIVHSTDTSVTTLDQIAAWVAAGNIKTTYGTAGVDTIGYARAGDVGISSFDGVAVATTDILLKYTYEGDANLDGKVDLNDFGALSPNFGHTLNGAGNPVTWSDGNFDGNSIVDLNDFGLLSPNFLKGTGGANGAPLAAGVAPVPEPASLGMLALGVVGLMTRRAKRRV